MPWSFNERGGVFSLSIVHDMDNTSKNGLEGSRTPVQKSSKTKIYYACSLLYLTFNTP